MPSNSPKLLNSTKTTPKNRSFWSNLDKIEVMIISLGEILELPNFGHMISSTI